MTAFLKVYKICILSHRCNLKIARPGDELCGVGCDPVALWEALPRLAKTQIILVLGWFESTFGLTLT